MKAKMTLNIPPKPQENYELFLLYEPRSDFLSNPAYSKDHFVNLCRISFKFQEYKWSSL